MDFIEPISRSSNLINANECLILIIDVQEEFMKGLSNKEQEEYIRKYIHLIKLSQVLDMPLIVTAEDIEKNGSILDSLQKQLHADVKVLDKFIYSCWGQHDIREKIKNYHQRDVIVVCGFETDVCIAQTTIDLLKNDYRVVVLTDMTYSRNKIENEIGLKRMEKYGVILSLLKTWQEEIAAGVKTKINQIIKDHNLANI